MIARILFKILPLQGQSSYLWWLSPWLATSFAIWPYRLACGYSRSNTGWCQLKFLKLSSASSLTMNRLWQNGIKIRMKNLRLSNRRANFNISTWTSQALSQILPSWYGTASSTANSWCTRSRPRVSFQFPILVWTQLLLFRAFSWQTRFAESTNPIKNTRTSWATKRWWFFTWLFWLCTLYQSSANPTQFSSG